ncbi:MAG: beta-eliminating lyase-related protein [Pseudomonas sp.]|uniref:beta-eliminating lyase-related protein n=1 Tax=unclassified Pseudomonas TaxID=196821 RepID=UPI001E50D7B2|nr:MULTISPECIES: beta-eliminating lyase-related protein [unclassified Pseudomonas]UVM67585.1 beta-eliminating lyase-related protein [Pseudomonas sp. B21-009]
MNNLTLPDGDAKPIDQLFSCTTARVDLWRELNALCRRWRNCKDQPASAKVQQQCLAQLEQLAQLEAYQAYPGPRLLALLVERVAAGNGIGALHLAQRISSSLLDRSYKQDANDWEASEDLPDAPAPRSFTAASAHRPYFETLIVSPAPISTWPQHLQAIRQLRRHQDPFIYEPVMTGSFEDALLAVILNVNLQAVVIYEGFAFTSSCRAAWVRELLAPHLGNSPDGEDSTNLALPLARAIKSIRPELDILLLSDRQVERIAGDENYAFISRVFYEVEEPLEIHLSLLQGVAKRYETPFFNNLKHYAQRPIGTFHALPIARGKSIFKSNWIRDMGEFYGINLFLAESSATTGGLDSLLEPTGNIKKAQDRAAHAFGAQQAFFVTNGTSTSNKIVEQALLAPGDIVIVDRNCHKSHHYAMVLTGAYPLYVEAYPLPRYSMYGAVPLSAIKQALLDLKKEGKLHRVKLLVLTNCTFDGHVYNTFRVMEECLAIKPDLAFLWDEAWFGFARFSPLLRRRTGMGAATQLKQALSCPQYRYAFECQRERLQALAGDDPALLQEHLLMDPDTTRVRVYQTNSTHKSMSALRQGSMILVDDQDFHHVEASFREAVFTHTSTSPNQQIIASLDVARRQMELEGYELVMSATQLAFDIRREVGRHPLISKYFKILTIEDLVPTVYRASGLQDYLAKGTAWSTVVDALNTDEVALDPTRLTLVCGHAGFDGTTFKNLLTNRYDVQLNKTSRNSVLLQTNINNTRSDVAHLIRVLVRISRELEDRLGTSDDNLREAFNARVTSLMEDVPDLPDFSHFYPAFRESANSSTAEGDIRSAYYKAYDSAACEHIRLFDKTIDERLENGPPLISANFVIPYPPGFPILVPGQVITAETLSFMRKLDVKEIHGYNADEGLKLLKSESIGVTTPR